MEEDLLQQELQKKKVLAQAKEKYGSRGMAQARAVYESAKGLYAGGRLSLTQLLTSRSMKRKPAARAYIRRTSWP